MASPKAEVAKLRAELEKHNRLYYVEATPQISDLEYDLSLIHISEPTRPY